MLLTLFLLAMGCGQKSFKLVWRCHQLLSGFLVKGHLSRVSRQSRSVANNKCDNEMILGTVDTSPGICLTAEENPSNPQQEDRLFLCVFRNAHASHPYICIGLAIFYML